MLLMQKVVAPYGYLDNLGSDNAKITDNGIRTTETANNPRVFGWQYKELKETLLNKALDATEALLNYLVENKNDWSLWTGSDAYISFSSLLIKTGADFDAHYKLFQPMRTFYSLKVLLDEVQEDYLKPAIGEDLLDYFISTDISDADEKALLKLMKKAAAYLTIYKAVQHYSVRFDANGFTIVSAGGDAENSGTSGRAATDLTRLNMLMQSCKNDGTQYITKLRKKLYDYRNNGGTHTDFDTAFDAGPLADYTDPSSQTSGNENWKGIFRI